MTSGVYERTSYHKEITSNGLKGRIPWNKLLLKDDCLEHKVPLSRGGTNRKNNLAVSCRKCNLKKGKKTEKEYRCYCGYNI